MDNSAIKSLNPKHTYLGKWLSAISIATKRIYWGNYSYYASSLAFLSILSFVPLMSVVLYVFTYFPLFQNLVHLSKQYIYDNYVPISTNIFSTYLNHFLQQTARLPILSIFFFFVTTIMLMMSVENIFNNVWYVERNKRRLVSIIYMFLIILLLPIYIGLDTILIDLLANSRLLLVYQKPILAFFNIIINSIIFFVFYYVTPSQKVNVQHCYIVSFFIACFFEIIKLGFTIYISNYANYTVIYGALAAVPILMVWVYTFWYIIIYGALIIHSRDDDVMKSKVLQNKIQDEWV